MKNQKYTLNKIQNKSIALVMDGFINGFGIVRSLKKGKDVFLLVLCKNGAALSYSNQIDAVITYTNKTEFIDALLSINEAADLVIPYYCSDLNLKVVLDLKPKLDKFYIHPLNLDLLTKEHQLKLAQEANIDIPKSFILKAIHDSDGLIKPGQTYIVKPAHAADGKDLYKAKISQDKTVLLKYIQICLDANVPAVLSIYIPGDDTTLYTFGGYSFKGTMISSFSGRKISQRPRYNGVASMAESIEDKKLVAIGSRFIKNIGFTGIFQIEFKVDIANNIYYFIEFNPRNWSWGYVATVSGKNLPLEKFRKESKINGYDISSNKEDGKDNFYFWFEGILYNILKDQWFGILPIAIKTFFKKPVTFAFWSFKDPMPFFVYIRNLISHALGIRKTLR